MRELRTQADWTEHGIAAFFAASGFRLSPRVVLQRALEHPVADEFAWEELPVRSMTERDLPAIYLYPFHCFFFLSQSDTQVNISYQTERQGLRVQLA